MDNMPDDVIKHIINMLSLRDIISLKLTHRRYNNLIRMTHSSISYLDIDYAPQWNNMKITRNIACLPINTYPHIQHSVISYHMRGKNLMSWCGGLLDRLPSLCDDMIQLHITSNTQECTVLHINKHATLFLLFSDKITKRQITINILHMTDVDNTKSTLLLNPPVYCNIYIDTMTISTKTRILSRSARIHIHSINIMVHTHMCYISMPYNITADMIIIQGYTVPLCSEEFAKMTNIPHILNIQVNRDQNNAGLIIDISP